MTRNAYATLDRKMLASLKDAVTPTSAARKLPTAERVVAEILTAPIVLTVAALGALVRLATLPLARR